MADLEIVIVNYKTPELTLNCLKSILEKKWKHKIGVMVIDNNSDDTSVDLIKKKYPGVAVFKSDRNLGFSGGNNLGINKTQSNLILLLNSDAEVKQHSLDNLIYFANRSDCGIISCQLLNRDGSFQANGGKLPDLLNIFLWLSNLDDFLSISSYQMKNLEDFRSSELGWVSGAAFLIKKPVIDKIGLLDENIFMYGEDVEYCLRSRMAGIKIGWTNQASIIHLGGGSSRAPQYQQWLGEFKGLLYIYQKYYGFLDKIILKLLIYFFVLLRSLAYLLTGKFGTSLTYAKIITKL